MFKYAWINCGYREENPATFRNPPHFCFTSNGTKGHECEKFLFIICGLCKISLCFIHFHTNYYFCDDSVI